MTEQLIPNPPNGRTLSEILKAGIAERNKKLPPHLQLPMPQTSDEFEEMTEAESAMPVRFKLTAFDDVRLDEDVDDIIKGLFPSSGLAVVWGPPKCGKSFWCFDALMHVALGRDYRGHRVTPGPIVYCALEGVRGFKRRVEAFRQSKLQDADARSPPFYLMPGSLSLVNDHGQLIADIRAQLGDQSPLAVAIDTLNRSLAGSENSDEDMAAYVLAADAIRDAFGCLVIIVHHCGHNADRPRGHSSLMGALDVQVAIKRDQADNIAAELELSKDGETGLKFLSRLKVVEVGRDRHDDPITSCVIEPVEAEVAAVGRTAATVAGEEKAERAFLMLLDLFTEQERAVSANPGKTYAPVIFERHPDAKGIRKDDFRDAMERLLTAKEIRNDPFGPPSRRRERLVRSQSGIEF
jgi:hypothetical protein